jgi:HD domain-containing protein
MGFTPHAISVPDTKLVKEATEILREHSTALIFNHSLRVYLFAAAQDRQAKLRFDPELLYVSAAFHDLGLFKKFSSKTERFEVGSANAARQFLTAHKVSEDRVRTAWEAIALHTTPGVTHYMKPEVAFLFSGVGLDVLGEGLNSFPADLRERIVADARGSVSVRNRDHKGANTTDSPRQSSGDLQKLRQVVAPDRRLRVRSVPSCGIAGGNQNEARFGHSLHHCFRNMQLRWIYIVIRGIDPQQRDGDFFQVWTGIVVPAGIQIEDDVVCIHGAGAHQILIDVFLRKFTRGSLLLHL